MLQEDLPVRPATRASEGVDDSRVKAGIGDVRLTRRKLFVIALGGAATAVLSACGDEGDTNTTNITNNFYGSPDGGGAGNIPQDAASGDAQIGDASDVADGGLDVREMANVPVGGFEILGSNFTVVPIAGHGSLVAVNGAEWGGGPSSPVYLEITGSFTMAGDDSDFAFAVITQGGDLVIKASNGEQLGCSFVPGNPQITGLPAEESFTYQGQCQLEDADPATIFVKQSTANLPHKDVPADLL